MLYNVPINTRKKPNVSKFERLMEIRITSNIMKISSNTIFTNPSQKLFSKERSLLTLYKKEKQYIIIAILKNHSVNCTNVFRCDGMTLH